VKYRNILDASDIAIQKIFAFGKRDASNALKNTLSNIQGRQDLRMSNVFCTTAIILQIIRDTKYIRNYKRTCSQHLDQEEDNNFSFIS
jgi:hypothetical protein